MVNRSLPDKRPIDAEVLVNQNAPQPHDVWPRYRVVPRRKFRAEPRNRFADDRQFFSDGVAKRLASQEIGLGPPGDRLRNPTQRFQDVA
jgi:hypothetical protein